MIHPATELRYINPTVGSGVFAREFIPRGTITWTRCRFDRTLSPAEVAALPAPYQRIIAHYAYNSPQGEIVLCWDIARFMNHSCDPTVMCIYDEVDIAVRDIQAGEQLTYEYGTLNIDYELNCQCGSANCRGKVLRDDALRYGPEWDERVRRALADARQVAQPLREFVVDLARLDDVLSGRAAPISQAELYSPPR